MNTPKPIDINPSVAATAIPVLLRQALLVIGGAVTLVSFLSARDMAGLWSYLQADEFVAWVGMAVTFGSLGWGQWRSLRNTADLTAIGREVDDSIAVVHEPSPRPAVDEV